MFCRMGSERRCYFDCQQWRILELCLQCKSCTLCWASIYDLYHTPMFARIANTTIPSRTWAMRYLTCCLWCIWDVAGHQEMEGWRRHRMAFQPLLSPKLSWIGDWWDRGTSAVQFIENDRALTSPLLLCEDHMCWYSSTSWLNQGSRWSNSRRKISSIGPLWQGCRTFLQF